MKKILTLILSSILLFGCISNKSNGPELFYETEWTEGKVEGVSNFRFKANDTKTMQKFLDLAVAGKIGPISGPWYIDENGEQVIAEQLFKD